MILTESQIKEAIREEFAKSGVILTEEELNELFGMFGKSKLIKQIKKLDPDGKAMDKLGYDAEEVFAGRAGSGTIKAILADLKSEVGEPEEEDDRGFVKKGLARMRGALDILDPRSEAGTLLGGDEVFDMKKRRQLMGDAKAALKDTLSKLRKVDPEGSNQLKKLRMALEKNGFPNMRGNGNFKTAATDIDIAYDQIIKDFEEKKIDCTTANVRIAVLRYIVIYYQDFRMGDQYYYRNEALTPEDLILLTEEEQEQLGVKQGAAAKGYETAYGMKFPKVLAAVGVGALAAGFLADSDFFQNLLERFKDVDEITDTKIIKDTVIEVSGLGEIESGEGIIKVVRRLGGESMKNFGRSGGPGMAELGDPKYSLVVKLLGAAMMSKQGPGALQQAIQQNADPVKLFISGPASGTGRAGEELFGLNKGVFEENLSKVIEDKTETFLKVPAKTLKNKFLSGLGEFAGPVLKALGLSALAGAGASAAMRYSGKGEGRFALGSRMSFLKKKVDEMEDVPCKETEEPKCPDGSDPPCKDEPPPPPGECSDEEKEQGKVWNPGTGKCECPEDQAFNDETGKCEEKKPDCDPDTQMVDPDTGECIDIPKCPDGTVYNPATGKCRRPRQLVQPQRLEITIYSEIVGKPGRPSVEKVVREFGAANGYKIDDENLEDTLGKIEQWVEWTNLRAYGLPRNAKAQPVNPKALLGLKEDNPLNELSPAPGSEGEETEKDPQNSFMPRSKSDVRDGKILIFVKKNGKGKIRRSLRNFLFTNIFMSQGQDTPFDRPLDRKDAKALAIAIGDFVFDELQQQGGEVVQQQQQQEAKQLSESLQLNRWKVLAGIK